jgi:tetratricopeptide (TPR) repeat protein
MTFWPGAVRALQKAVPAGSDGADVLETIADLESRDLVRVEPRAGLGGEVAYSFKHVLVRDAAYESLPKGQRRELHRAADSWLSAAAGERVGEFSDQLAHHALASGEPERALEYLTTAADRSRRAAAHRREAALLAQAVDIARTLDRSVDVAELRMRRGKALLRLTQWAEARAELEAALDELAETQETEARRAEIHNDLSLACFWLLDTANLRAHGHAALDLARRSGSREQELAARVQLTSADSAEGEVDLVLSGGRTLINDALTWGIEPPYERLNVYGLNLYLTGDWRGAIELSQQGVEMGKARGDTQFVLQHLSQGGVSAAAAGRFDDAIATFEEARRFGQEYEMIPGLPRCIAMSAVCHFDLFDFAGAEAVHEEARELGAVHFPPSAVSAGIDMLFNYARRGEVERALPMIDAVGEQVATGGGWHGWLWALRFATVRAEIACATGDHAAAIEFAHGAITKSRSKRRAKYEAFARIALGRALVATGREHEGLEELRSAVAITDRLGHPAAHVFATANLLDVEPDESAALSGRAAIERVLDGLSDAKLRERFLSSDPVRTIGVADRTTPTRP